MNNDKAARWWGIADLCKAALEGERSWSCSARPRNLGRQDVGEALRNYIFHGAGTKGSASLLHQRQ
jgi:hypothetical protein